MHIKNLEEVAKFSKARNLPVVVIPLLNYNLRKGDKILPQEEIASILKKQFNAQLHKIGMDEEGIYHTELKSNTHGEFILKSTDLNNIQPYTACKSCLTKENCQEGIFPMRVSATGYISPCLAGGLQSINVRDTIKNREEATIRNALSNQY